MKIRSEQFSKCLLNAMTGGTAAALLDEGGAKTQIGTHQEIIVSSIRSFIEEAELRLKDVEGEDASTIALVLVEYVAISEALYEVALRHCDDEGVSNVRSVLRDSLRSMRIRLFDLSADDWDREGLLELARMAVRIGGELLSTEEGLAGTETVTDFLREIGTHAESEEDYMLAVHTVFSEIELSNAMSFHPGGNDFQEIQRLRVRWGNERF